MANSNKSVPTFALRAAVMISDPCNDESLWELVNAMCAYEENGEIPGDDASHIVNGFMALYSECRDLEKDIDKMYE